MLYRLSYTSVCEQRRPKRHHESVYTIGPGMSRVIFSDAFSFSGGNTAKRLVFSPAVAYTVSREVIVTEYFFTTEEQLPPGVGFTLFGREHLLWLLICLTLTATLCLFYRRGSPRGRARFRRALGLAIFGCELARDANLVIQGVFSVYYLPLHLCGLAVFLTLWHSLRPGETLANLLYSTCMPGALFAVLFPDWTAFPAFSYHSIVGFTVHALLIAYPLSQVLGGDFCPDARRLPRCLLWLLGMALPVYLFDRAVEANYMFLLHPSDGSPLVWLASFLGTPGYLLGYIPMIALIWLALYLPFRSGKRKRQQ